MATSWEHWATLFAPNLTTPTPGAAGQARRDLPGIQRNVERGEALTPEQAALVAKLRSMLTPYKGLVVSGGVSLGSYQAGFLYYTTFLLRRFDEELRQRGWTGPDVGRFRVVTGASAGSINGFLSSLAGCRALSAVPEESPFFQAWIDVGLRELRGRGSSFDALFDAEALDRPVRDALALIESGRGWTARSCDGIFGVTATRLDPRPIALNDPDASPATRVPDVTLARQTEKFLIRYEVGGQATRPQFASYRLAWEDGSPLMAAVYPTLGIAPATTPGDVRVAPADLATLLRASAAFPVAFTPVAVPLTVWERGPGDKLVPRLERPRFLDGGLLDNTPLRLAQKLILSEGCSSEDGADLDPRGATILFFKSGTESWRPPAVPPTLEETERINRAVQTGTLPKKDQTIIAELGGFVFDFINNATDLEALEALEVMAEDEAFADAEGRAAPEAAGARTCRTRRRIVSPEVPVRGMPVTGQFLGHFGAFLERDFRVFDFYQGVADAREHAAQHLRLNPAIAPVSSPILTCLEAYRAALAGQPAAGPLPGLPAVCDGVPANLRALALASARVRQAVWRSPHADELAVFLTALHDEGFRYHTLAHDESLDAEEVQAVLREELHDALHELGRAQGPLFSPSVLAVSVGAKAGADLYRHRAPVFLGIGFASGLELSAGLLGDSLRSASGRFSWKLVPSLRWGAPGRYLAVDEQNRLSADPPLRTISFDGAGELRLEIDLRPWLEPVQVELGLGYGARARTRALARFIPEPANGVSFRHGPVASLTLIFAQRLYATVTAARWWQRPCRLSDVNATGDGCPGIADDVRAYEPIETTRWPWRLSAGWRSMW